MKKTINKMVSILFIIFVVVPAGVCCAMGIVTGRIGPTTAPIRLIYDQQPPIEIYDIAQEAWNNRKPNNTKVEVWYDKKSDMPKFLCVVDSTGNTCPKYK